MTENEGSVNKQPDIEQANQELDPWLRKRLEERARPLTSHGLLQLVQSGSHLARWVINHTGLSSLISRVSRLTFLSGASRSIIRRTTTTELPDTYRMLDLPWFRPGQNVSQSEIDDIGFSTQEITISDTVDKSKVKLPQPLSEFSREKEKVGYKKTPLQPRPESFIEKETIGSKKTPEPYISRLISPPITRKTTADIGNKIVSTSLKKSPSVQTRQVAEVTYPVVPDRLPERKPSTSSERRPEISVPRTMISAKRAPDVSKLKPPQSHQTGSTATKSSDISKSDKLQTEVDKEKTKEIDKQLKGVYSRQSPKPTQQISLARTPPDKITGLSNTSSHLSDIRQSNQQKTIDSKTLPSRIKNQQVSPDETDESPATDFITAPDNATLPVMSDTRKTKEGDSPTRPQLKEAGHISPTTEKLQLNTLPSTTENKGEKGASEVYPAKDLFYRKPLSIGRKIVQSLPIIRNILRKVDRVPVTIPPPNEKRLDLNDTKLSPKKSEMARPDVKSSGMLPENAASPDISPTHETKAEDSLLIPDSNEIRYENLAIETFNLKASDTAGDQVTEKKAIQAYPAKDLVYRKSLPIGQQITGTLPLGQQIVRTLPLIRNMSRKASLPSEPILPISEKPPESHDIRLLLNTPETVRVPDVNDNAYLPVPSLPITSPVVTDTVLTAASDETPISRQIAALRDFTKPSNNRGLDLVLAPINHTSMTTPQQVNYVQTVDVTQYLSRTQTPSSSQPIIQTQPEQSQQPSTTQGSTTQTTESTGELSNNKPDVKALAREIYPLIRRMIIIERERRPSR